jgi:hypothetical protein
MFRDVTRSKLIQMWFVAISLVVVAAVTLGTTLTVGTGAALLAFALVPPAVLFALWPKVQPMTASDVLHGRDRRAESEPISRG